MRTRIETLQAKHDWLTEHDARRLLICRYHSLAEDRYLSIHQLKALMDEEASALADESSSAIKDRLSMISEFMI